MKKLLLILSIGFLGVSCTQLDLEQPGKRFLSKAISCETDSLCFSKVDSLLWENGEQASVRNLEWRELAKADTIINFHEYSEAGVYATILVLDNYEAEEAGDYILRLGSDDGFRIFVNEEEIASRVIGRALQLDSDWIPIHLEKGKNQLIIQVNQGTGDWKLHYKIDKGEHLKELMEDQLIEIYRDLPDLNILSDTSKVLVLIKDPRQKLDEWHSISYEWEHPETGKTIEVEHHNAKEAPQIFHLPDNPQFPLLFKYSIRGDGEEELFSETIPIFSEESVEGYVQEAYDKLNSKPGKEQWSRGLELVFPEYLDTEQVQTYSTRIKTELLWDALIQTGYKFPKIGGPRMTDINRLISRVYRPNSFGEKPVNVLGINPQPEEDTLEH